MRLIQPSFEIIEQESGLNGIYKHIELAGRTCYKSLDKITKDSAKEFVDRMIKSGHGAMLEHGTVYLRVPEGKMYRDGAFRDFNEVFTDNLYYRMCSNEGTIYITTNYRYIIENHLEHWLEYLCEPTEYHEKRVTVKFVTDQGILREFTRHRVFSFAVESTRYCNYSKDKFDNEVTYILPPWIDKNLLPSDISFHYSMENWGTVCEHYYDFIGEGKKDWNISDVDIRNFLFALDSCEQMYLSLIKQGWAAQQARNILPLATKCDIVMTGFVSDWKHFFRLRALGTTGAPHPQAKEIAEPLRQEFIKRNLIK
jgi:thymidylate synthase (FAD)